LQTLGKRGTDSEQRNAFEREFAARWVPKALNGFNDDDVWAREATEPFYADDRGWLAERLFEPDGNIIEWRRLASKHARGRQQPRHVDPPRPPGKEE
jgi:carbazole 1,9a-dioxygenase terminal dioxygenase component